jgi:hypothetical protein
MVTNGMDTSYMRCPANGEMVNGLLQARHARRGGVEGDARLVVLGYLRPKHGGSEPGRSKLGSAGAVGDGAGGSPCAGSARYGHDLLRAGPQLVQVASPGR